MNAEVRRGWQNVALCTAAFVVWSAGAAVYDVKRFGAVGDGVAKDTVAIQKAIDAAAAAGGGTVEVPAGTYLTGSLYLKSNVDFFVSQGATLKGSPDKEDYYHPIRDVRFINVECNTPIELINVEGCEIVGGTLKAAALSPSEMSDRRQKIENGYHPN